MKRLHMTTAATTPARRPASRAWAAGMALVAVLGCDAVSIVQSPVETITVAPAVLEIRTGQSRQLIASLTGPDGVALPGRSVQWSSEDPQVALVDASGTVVAIGIGQTRINARADGVTGSALVTVLTENALELDRSSVVFTAQPSSGTSDPINVMITPAPGQQITGLAVEITYPAGSTDDWLGAVLSSSDAPAVMTLTANGDGMSPGTYTALVDVTATDVPSARLTASLVVSSRSPSILLGRTAVALSAPEGESPAPQEVAVLNGGDGAVTGLTATTSYPSGQPAGWLTATLLGTQAPTALRLVAASSGLGRGTYGASVLVQSPDASNSPQRVDVTLTVAPPGPLIGATPAELVFEAVQNTGPPAPDSFTVTNTGSDALTGVSMRISYTAGEPSGWLSVSPQGTSAPLTAAVRPTNTGLPVGTYRAAIDVMASVARNSPQVVNVTYTILEPPALELDSTSVTFNAVEDGADPAPSLVRASNAGGTALDSLRLGSVTYSGGGSGWLSVSLNTSVAPAFITLAPSAAGLPAGLHQATVQVVADDQGVLGSPATISVTLDVEDRPSADLAISVSDGVTEVVSGEQLTYTIQVQNLGPGSATGAMVTDTFPSGLTGVTWTCTPDAQSTCDVASGAGDLALGLTLGAGATVTIAATGTVTGSGVLVNRARVANPVGLEDPVPGNNLAVDDDTNILVPVSVGISKTDSAAVATVGETLVYRIVVSNGGPGVLTGAAVVDTFPASLSNVTWNCAVLSGPAGSSCNAAASGNTLGTVNLTAGGAVLFTASGVATQAGQVVNTAHVIVPAGHSDDSSADNVASDSTTVLGVPPTS